MKKAESTQKPVTPIVVCIGGRISRATKPAFGFHGNEVALAAITGDISAMRDNGGPISGQGEILRS